MSKNPDYKFNQIHFDSCISVSDRYVDGTGLCLSISKIKIHHPVPYKIIKGLEKAHEINPEIVMKIDDAFIIEGYCLCTVEETKMHTIIMKNKYGIWIRGTRADEPFIVYKVTQAVFAK